VDITLLDRCAALDVVLLEGLRDVVNQAFAQGEAGLWQDGFQRTSTTAIGAIAAAGELAVARDGDRLLGCVRVAPIDDTTAELGLLSVADDLRSSGVGSALVSFAEQLSRERGFATMRLQLLVPRASTHPFKQRLDAWYRRLGYSVLRREAFAARHPQPAHLLVTPCDFVIYERPLS
jgi:GNAT superfamily N-acetyltransferase